jgi:uncharacterized protein (DUF2384 family)
VVGVPNGRDAAFSIGAGRLDEIALWLTTNIGPRLVAYAADTTRSDLARAAQGLEVDDKIDQRLRCLYAVVTYVAQDDGAGTAHDFLVRPNPDLDGRAPAELLHDGAPPERVWMAAVPAF